MCRARRDRQAPQEQRAPLALPVQVQAQEARDPVKRNVLRALMRERQADQEHAPQQPQDMERLR